MTFKLTNITDKRTAYINLNCVQFIEKNNDNNMAILTMANGEVFNTNEDHDELIKEWGIIKCL